LQQAALISSAQVEVALRDRVEYPELRIGEILALHGWLKAETADFFAERWPLLITQQWVYPIGYYLKEAALLEKIQIDNILFEQRRRKTWLRFGELVVQKKWLKQTTIDFFLLAKKGHSSTSTLADIIDRVLNSGQITCLEQDRFLEVMLQETPLSDLEQAGIQEIFKRIQTGQLQIVK
jgi:hypothetical protein